MTDNNLPKPYNNNRQPLWLDIKKFSGNKYGLALILLLLALLGIFIPVFPGILFFLLAVALFKPGLMSKIRSKIKSFSGKKNS